jgi:prephenate dehydratase
MRVGVLGPQGTFSEIAAKKWCATCELVYFDEIPDVVEAVMIRRVDAGVVPIENSIEGSVNITLDLLAEQEIKIIGEVIVPIVHNLLANRRTQELHTIASHPQALAQCRRYLRTHHRDVKLEVTSSTASAAELASKVEGVAAIASLESARAHGLSVIAEGIQDVPGNFTRFAVLACEIKPRFAQKCKTSIILHLKHNRAGALYELLGEFAKRGVDLTKIESRPTKKALEDYLFYLDFKGHIEEERIISLLEGVRKHVDQLKVLGSYPAAEKN